MQRLQCVYYVLLGVWFIASFPVVAQYFSCSKTESLNQLFSAERGSFNTCLPRKLGDWKKVLFEIGETLYERIELLGSVTQDHNPAVLDRPFLSSANRKAATLIKDWLLEAGFCNVSLDWVGNVAGWYEGNSCHTKTLILGSHYDTVKDAGKYDGTYGILVSIGVVEALYKLQVTLPFDIQIVAFENEEGNNDFGLVHTGSTFYVAGSIAKRNGARIQCYRMLKSQLDTKSAVHSNQSFADYILEKIAISEQHSPIDRKMLINYFCRHYPLAVDKEVLGYWEWHIEQGPVLDISRKEWGLVSSICGQQRWSFDVRGKAGHAGTVPMFVRQDSVAACVEMIQQVEEITRSAVRDSNGTVHLVATVGNISISPGSSNVIPNLCSFTMDIRCESDVIGESVRIRITQKIKEIAKRRKIKVDYRQLHRTKTVEMNSNWMEVIKYGAYLSNQFYLNADWIKWLKQKLWKANSIDNHIPVLVSGAGHDAAILHQLYNVNMAFIRCREGLSHHPKEYASKEDMLAGAITLFFSLLALANTTKE
ncbi:hypothetical protein GpartN1_g8.t1 [Galdieria partita]|uniref:Peptidase M20 dimerisation domain-containing protein n=1 Tax=Galdieria partita TaxID=83374 RepID=A0A9C7PR43_9RHOD|nr:hypothetical protein GpartN1_g8.t1 [Galdieria partita]